jgi:uncharacterized repeat protein (TIGR01451 family)
LQQSAVTKSATPARMPVHRLLALAVLALGSPAAALASTPPAGLSAADWESLRAQVTAARHTAEPLADGGHVAVNPVHGIRVEYRPDGATSLSGTREGATWTGSLRLTGYGYQTLQPVAQPRRVEASGATVTYAWDDTVAEWWWNSPLGLEQGFTLARPPAGRGTHGPLRLAMAWHGELEPRAQGDGAVFVDAAGGAAFTYAGLHTWDANGKVLPTRLALAGSTLTLLVDDAGAEYPVTVDPWVQQAYLKASNTGANDNFGWSVAISGDTVIVGAPGEDSNATGVDGNQTSNSSLTSGAAYVFVRSGSSWSQQAYLKASNTGADDQFGSSVAISGDTVVVGAHREDSIATGVDGNQADNSASNSGAAYVFVRSGTTWSQQAYLKASNTGAGDQFGFGVTISGDTVVVGAYGENSNATGVDGNQFDNSATLSGAAYVFVRSGSTWSQQAYLKASNAEADDQFGYSVAISGDTVVVSALSEDSSATGVDGNQADNSASDSGAAYVFVRSGSSWSQQAYLKASNTEANDQFGLNVAISGDTAVVGAYGEDSNATGVDGNQTDNSTSLSGAAYVFARSGSTWSQQAYLKASNTGASDFFGNSVAISGDIVMVGAPFEDSNATGVDGDQSDNSASNSGAAYVFHFTRPDLSLTKADGGASVAPGGTVAYALTYANNGSAVATGVTLTETVPANTTFNPGASTAGWSCAPDNNAGSTCTLAIGSVAAAAGGSATFAVTVDDPLPGGVTEVSNSASIADDGANGSDPNAGNNSAADTTPVVVPTADVSATKTASPGPYFVGDPLTYTIILTNTGSGAQGDNPGDELLDVLPASLALVSANATSGTAFANLATNTVTWNGAIPAAGAVTVTIQATILPAAAGTTVVNQGDVAFDGDANGTNETTVTTDDPAAGGVADATAIQIAGSSVVEIPTLGEVGLLLLLFGLAALSLARLRRARSV